MDNNQVNMWLSMNADKFNQQDLGPIRRTLEAIPDNQIMIVQNIDFKKPFMIFLIALLLGWERFLLGSIGLGILKIFSCYGFGIWWLVDVITAKKRTRDYNFQLFQKATVAYGLGNNNSITPAPVTPDTSAKIDTNQPVSSVLNQTPNNTSSFVSNPDLQSWHHAIQGIEAEQNELSPYELSAFQELVTLINTDNFESGESSANVQVIKSALNRHSSNALLTAYLTIFVALCDKYFKIQAVTAIKPELTDSPQQIAPPLFVPPTYQPTADNTRQTTTSIESPDMTEPQEISPKPQGFFEPRPFQSPEAEAIPTRPQNESYARINGMPSDSPQVKQPNKTAETNAPKSRTGNSPVMIIMCLVILLLVGYIAFKDSEWYNRIFRKEYLVSVTSVSLNTTTLTLNIGDSYQIIPYIQPANATNRRVLWRSDNSDVAIVYGEDGIVIARSAGLATITATTQDGRRTAICNVSVRTSPASSTRARNYYFGEYTGDLKNGIPEGDGKLIYNRRMQIAKHDTNNPPHYADQGDYFIGSWGNGDIVSGYLYRRDGNIKERILAPKRFNPYDISKD